MYPSGYFYNDMPASLYFVRKIAYKWFGVYRRVLTCIWLWLSAMYLTMTICNTQIKANFSHITLHACMCPLCVEDCLYVYQRPCLWRRKNEIFSVDWLHWSTQPCLIGDPMQQLHEHIYIADKFLLTVCTADFKTSAAKMFQRYIYSSKIILFPFHLFKT